MDAVQVSVAVVPEAVTASPPGTVGGVVSGGSGTHGSGAPARTTPSLTVVRPSPMEKSAPLLLSHVPAPLLKAALRPGADPRAMVFLAQSAHEASFMATPGTLVQDPPVGW